MTREAAFSELAVGEPAPWFRQRSAANPAYCFDTVGGRYVVLCFFASASSAEAGAALSAAQAAGDVFDDVRACFFGVTADPGDAEQLKERYPGYRYIWDFDGAVARLYGAMAADGSRRGLWIATDPTLRVLRAAPLEAAGAEIAFLRGLPPPHLFTGSESLPPVLVLPNAFEPELCEALLALYRRSGGEESGFMRDNDGKTELAYDDAHKRRRDCIVADPDLVAAIKSRVSRRIAPEVRKVFQFRVTRMERLLIGCYSAAEGGHFRAHRDNTTRGTAHRRFAVTINLNADFDGGELSFPEYGPRSFKPPPGGAVVFSCSLLHGVSRVKRGERFAFLPFLYDEAAAELRERNNPHLADGVQEYRRDYE